MMRLRSWCRVFCARSLLFAAALLVPLSALPAAPSGRSQAKPKAPSKPAPKIVKTKLPPLGKADPKDLAVAKVDPATNERARLAAAKIDSLVEANYLKHNIQPNPLTSDEQFVRRAYLDITGTIPTLEQSISFLDSKESDKRTRLIDELLNSPGYASHSFNYWANILRLVDTPDPNIYGAPYIAWVKESLRDNKPYDQWVREMLTADGKIWDNPAAGYMLRDSGMPLDSINNTVRVFLGTQIGCAQCHDHPFDRWTQREFYQMAAYTFGIRTRYVAPPQKGPRVNHIERLRQEMIAKNTPGSGGIVQLMRANTYAVSENPKQVLKLPHDYQYSDAKPGDVIKPQPIFGSATPLAPGQSPREVFAKWMTSPENPRFAKAIANRLWKRVLGVGLIEPVDDIRDNSIPENPELLDYLTTIVVKLDFDLKEFQRILYNTRTYQRESSTHELADGAIYHFPGPILRRMTAEQVWDSLLTLAIKQPDTVVRPSLKGMAEAANLDPATATVEQLVAKWDHYNNEYGRKALQDMRKEYGYKGELLARASEQPLPAPAGHFLREFGQGDREQIEGARTEGNVPQILVMFNGPVTHMMLEEGSVIYDNVVRARTVNDRIDVIFLSMLSRRATSGARSLAMKEVQVGGPAGYGNVIWSLLNTREFLFIQ